MENAEDLSSSPIGDPTGFVPLTPLKTLVEMNPTPSGRSALTTFAAFFNVNYN